MYICDYCVGCKDVSETFSLHGSIGQSQKIKKIAKHNDAY